MNQDCGKIILWWGWLKLLFINEFFSVKLKFCDFSSLSLFFHLFSFFFFRILYYFCCILVITFKYFFQTLSTAYNCQLKYLSFLAQRSGQLTASLFINASTWKIADNISTHINKTQLEFLSRTFLPKISKRSKK